MVVFGSSSVVRVTESYVLKSEREFMEGKPRGWGLILGTVNDMLYYNFFLFKTVDLRLKFIVSELVGGLH